MAAGGLIVAAPVLILYVIFQRKFIAGMLAGALKE
jgi:raffinose/stachyose/melibiose transport system permease protein